MSLPRSAGAGKLRGVKPDPTLESPPFSRFSPDICLRSWTAASVVQVADLLVQLNRSRDAVLPAHTLPGDPVGG
ncbi:hypothetical protein [Candidatus Spongiisocius sp.]|uniref:hypothetical protein n=1 Tax=Candidatus Spongiisocius sp. TaxID=3101273 RepID=UPI003B5A2F77